MTLTGVLGVCKYLDEVDADNFTPLVHLDRNLELCADRDPPPVSRISPHVLACLKFDTWVVGGVFKWYATRLNSLVLPHLPVPPAVVVDNVFMVEVNRDYLKHKMWMQDRTRDYRYLKRKEQFQIGLFGNGWATQLGRWDCKGTLIIPNNSKADHWNVFQVHPAEKRVVILDSAGRGRAPQRKLGREKDMLDALTEMLELYMAVEFPAQITDVKWRREADETVPKQSNGSDCGIFSLLYMDLLSRGLSCDVEKLERGVIRNMRYILASELIADARLEPASMDRQ